ncbi:hypothetical protein AC230_01575 [Streptomyces caatingaensis]|uniref:Uncharacterized protein n=1 Tax=Streptomyces caatingaensis TaxID=1678637 RepID=A0A0K9XJ50_9ACTN|nr:hypothetical protein AC230_01575 [Streptomyces caatingaensis]
MTRWPRNDPTRTSAAAKSTAPKTIIRGGGALDSRKRRTRSQPASTTPVCPGGRTEAGIPGRVPRDVPSTTASPADPSARRATVTASPRSTDANAALRAGRSAGPTGVTRISTTPPQVRPTAKASSSDRPKVRAVPCPVSRDSRHSS